MNNRWVIDNNHYVQILYTLTLIARGFWAMFSYDYTCTSLSTCFCIMLCSVNCVCSLLSCNVTGYCENEASIMETNTTLKKFQIQPFWYHLKIWCAWHLSKFDGHCPVLVFTINKLHICQWKMVNAYSLKETKTWCELRKMILFFHF